MFFFLRACSRNRYGICSKHGIAFNPVQNSQFTSIDDVHLWMIDQHPGRRGVSDFQRGVQPTPDEPSASATLKPESLITRDAITKAARISSNTISQIEKIQKSAAPEPVAAVKLGTISINAAATVAGGKKKLQQAARQARETRALARTEPRVA